jgi:hypothetical protein
MTILKKTVVVYIIVATLLCVLFGFLAYKNNEVVVYKTNYIKLTNYVDKTIPRYTPVNITNILYLSNSNFCVVMTPEQYINLQTVVVDDSNYSQSLIEFIFSNGTVIGIHYKTTNSVKLPINLLNPKLNTFSIGYTVRQKYFLGYDYNLYNSYNFDVGLGAFILVPNSIMTNDYDIGIKLIIRK